MSRPSDGFTLDELRDEFDWMFEFSSRMAERIRADPDVHNHVDYVNKLEVENAKLRKIARLCVQAIKDCGCDPCPHYDDETCPVEIYPMRDGCKLYAEMCELGIEVG